VVSTLLLVMPILTPALLPLGVDPVHCGIVFTHNMEVGLVHPPVGLNLYVLATISDAPIGEVIRGIPPFLVILLIVLAIITYVPELTLWLAAAGPRQLTGRVAGRVPAGRRPGLCSGNRGRWTSPAASATLAARRLLGSGP
jgi:hypothetical protein